MSTDEHPSPAETTSRPPSRILYHAGFAPLADPSRPDRLPEAFYVDRLCDEIARNPMVDPFEGNEHGTTPYMRALEMVTGRLNVGKASRSETPGLVEVQEGLADRFLTAADLDRVEVNENNVRGLTQIRLMVSDDHLKLAALEEKMMSRPDLALHSRSEAHVAWDLHALTHGWNRPLEVWADRHGDDAKGLSQMKMAYENANEGDTDPLRPGQRPAFLICPVSGDVVSARVADRQRRVDEEGRSEMHQVFELGERRLSRDTVEASFAHAHYALDAYGFVDPVGADRSGKTAFDKGLDLLETAVRKGHMQVYDAGDLAEALAEKMVSAPSFDVEKAYESNPAGAVRIVSMLTHEKRAMLDLPSRMPTAMKSDLEQGTHAADVVALRRELYQETGVDDKTRLRWPVPLEPTVSTDRRTPPADLARRLSPVEEKGSVVTRSVRPSSVASEER